MYQSNAAMEPGRIERPAHAPAEAGLRFARQLARMVDPFPSSQLMRLAREATKARARRAKFFKPSLFSDPAWDILLELFAVEGEGKRLSVTGAGATAGIPPTTALRWLNVLEQEGLITRTDDPLDGRRSFVSLTHEGFKALTNYFEGFQEPGLNSR